MELIVLFSLCIVGSIVASVWVGIQIHKINKSAKLGKR